MNRIILFSWVSSLIPIFFLLVVDFDRSLAWNKRYILEFFFSVVLDYPTWSHAKTYKLDQSTTFAKVLVDGAWKSSYSLAVSMLSFLPRPKETIVKALTWFMTLLFDHTLLQHYDSMNKTQPLRCSHAVHTDIFHDSFFMIWNRDLVVSASHQIGYFRRM